MEILDVDSNTGILFFCSRVKKNPEINRMALPLSIQSSLQSCWLATHSHGYFLIKGTTWGCPSLALCGTFRVAGKGLGRWCQGHSRACQEKGFSCGLKDAQCRFPLIKKGLPEMQDQIGNSPLTAWRAQAPLISPLHILASSYIFPASNVHLNLHFTIQWYIFPLSLSDLIK